MTHMIDRWTAVQPILTSAANRLIRAADRATEKANELTEAYRAVRVDADVPGFVPTSLRLDADRAEKRAEKFNAQATAVSERAARGPEVKNVRPGWQLSELDKLDTKLREGKLRAKDYRRASAILLSVGTVEDYRSLLESSKVQPTAKV